MYKKTITYTDYNGVERTEDFYFNLSKAEIAEMSMTAPGGDISAHLERIVNAKDPKVIVDTFKQLIMMSYGEKDETGRRFVKSKELSEAFAQTEAYSEFFMELATDDKAGTAFVNGIIPQPEPTRQDAVSAA